MTIDIERAAHELLFDVMDLTVGQEKELREKIILFGQRIRDEERKHKKNLLMFFEVAAKSLSIDPSCNPGELDPMCTADTIRRLEQENKELKEGLKFYLHDGWHGPAKELLAKYPKDSK